MLLVIEGWNLPGTECGSHRDVYVGLQVGREPTDLVPADAAGARWDVQIELVQKDGQPDFRGPAVQGKRGERFVYLTWVGRSGDAFEMFRRAKLMLSDLPDTSDGSITARVDLTDDRGLPRCARLKPPALTWV